MPTNTINGVNIFWEMTGQQGDPLVLVHGSWGDHHNWDAVVGEFSKKYRVLTYDRRGHSQSERLPGQGSVEQDIDDLIGLVNHLSLSPAHIVGNSFGAGIVLKTAAKRPDIFSTLVIHEPPLLGVLKENPQAQEALQVVNERVMNVIELIAAGKMEQAAEEFMEKIAMGPGSWEKLPNEAKETFIYNAPTWYDEMQDPQSLEINLSSLSSFNKPTLISMGTESPPFFPLVIDKLANALPHAKRVTFEGAGHVPHMSHPAAYVEMVSNFCK